MKYKITKSYLSTHFRYQAAVYIAVVLIAIFGVDLLFTMTKYVPPAEKTINVYFASNYFTMEDREAVLAEAYEDFPDMELIDFIQIDMSAQTGVEHLQMILAAHQGDVFLIDRSYLSFFASQLIAVPLDDYLAAGTLAPTGGRSEPYHAQPRPG